MLKGSIYWSYMNLEIHRSVEGKNVFLGLIGDLDMAGAPVLRQSIVKEVSQGNIFLVLDFAGVHFIDSSGLGSIIGGLRRVRSNQGNLFLVGVDDELQKIFRLCELDKIFKMESNRETFSG